MAAPKKHPPKTKPKAPRKAAAAPDPTKPKKRAQTPQTPWQEWSADPARAIADLCDYIVSGGNLWAYSQERGLSYSTIRDWIAADPERDAKYARAREDRSDKLADEIVSISDDDGSDMSEDENGRPVTNHAAVQRAKLRVDARKWVAAKLKPRVYGDKVQLDATVDARSMSDDELAKRLARFGITAITPLKTEDADGGD